MIRLILADDDAIIRQGLTMILQTQEDMDIVATAENGQQAVELCRIHRPDVALLDIRMPVLDGIEAGIQILQEKNGSPLLLTTFDEAALITRAVQAGIKGYILKNSPSSRILSAIRAVADGGVVFQEDILDFIREQAIFPPKKPFSNLSPREQEIVELVAQGLSNQEIADTLFLSNGTVRNHISLILEKTGLSHRTQIAVKYLAGWTKA